MDGSEASYPIGIVKKQRPATAGMVTEFEIVRNGITYDVKVKNLADIADRI